jgi:TPR repeat protein
MYQGGIGVVKDYFTAASLYQKAVDAGDGRAMANLASLYSTGSGVQLDNAKALALYEKAIEAGNAFALGQTGVMYFNGKGVPRDLAAAEQYFLQAAALADGYSMKFLAIMYENGLVGPADPAKAAQYRLRAEEEDPGSGAPQVTFAKPAVAYTQHVQSRRRVVYYHWSGGGYNPAWQAAPGDNRCCPNNMLVCPLGRHWC